MTGHRLIQTKKQREWSGKQVCRGKILADGTKWGFSFGGTHGENIRGGKKKEPGHQTNGIRKLAGGRKGKGKIGSGRSRGLGQTTTRAFGNNVRKTEPKITKGWGTFIKTFVHTSKTTYRGEVNSTAGCQGQGWKKLATILGAATGRRLSAWGPNGGKEENRHKKRN